MSVTFCGNDLFGPYAKTHHQANPVSEQRGTYWGIDGVKRVYGGSRGRRFIVECWLLASSPGGLRDAEAAIQAYATNGSIGELIDEYGYTWPNVIFTGQGNLDGPVGFVDGGYAQHWTGQFEGLT